MGGGDIGEAADKRPDNAHVKTAITAGTSVTVGSTSTILGTSVTSESIVASKINDPIYKATDGIQDWAWGIDSGSSGDPWVLNRGTTLPSSGFTFRAKTGSIEMGESNTATYIFNGNQLQLKPAPTGNFLIFHDDAESSTELSGGNAVNNGANIKVYGSVHASGKNIQFRQANTTLWEIDGGADLIAVSTGSDLKRVNNTVADATPGQDFRIKGANKTAGTGDGGNIPLEAGTSVGGVVGTVIVEVGPLAVNGVAVALTADNQSVVPTKSLIVLSSDNVTATNRTIVLPDGKKEGQLLTLVFNEATNAAELVDDDTQACLSATWLPTNRDAIDLVWVIAMSCWVEKSRSVN